MFLSIQRRAWYNYLLDNDGTYSQESEHIGKFPLQV